MTNHWTIMMTLATFLAVCSTTMADEAKVKTDKAPAEAQTTEKAEQPTLAQLEAQLHRTLAALVEARAEENPDPAQIDKLAQRAQTLRRQIFARSVEANFNAPCPWGGPGLGLGRGLGYGRGAGYGWGRGDGLGRGLGYGRGPGYGRGAGWGAAYGFPGRGFIDRDGNGVCDRFELQQAQ